MYLSAHTNASIDRAYRELKKRYGRILVSLGSSPVTGTDTTKVSVIFSIGQTSKESSSTPYGFMFKGDEIPAGKIEEFLESLPSRDTMIDYYLADYNRVEMYGVKKLAQMYPPHGCKLKLKLKDGTVVEHATLTHVSGTFLTNTRPSFFTDGEKGLVIIQDEEINTWEIVPYEKQDLIDWAMK